MTDEAEELFAQQVARWRGESWSDLRVHLNEPVVYEVTGPSGLAYQFEVEVFWDDRHKRNLRVFITSDDGKGWRIVGRMRSDDFIKAPDDTFVGE